MTTDKAQLFIVENGKIGMRNFSGKESKMNPAGRRTFALFLSLRQAEELTDLGWSVSILDPLKKDPDGDSIPFIRVRVRFDVFPPRIVRVCGKHKTVLDEAHVSLLDSEDIISVDAVLSPYYWTVNGKTGVTAYLKSMFVTVREDPFEGKFSDIPYSPQ